MRWWILRRLINKNKRTLNISEMPKTTDPSSDIKNVGASKADVIESVVCQNSDLKENEMRVFELGKDGDQVLVVKQFGKVYALGNKCSHYGAPLVNGALGKGRVRCPWHGACFNIATGDIEDFPGLDSIPRFNCEIIAGGGIKVSANKNQLKEHKRCRVTTIAKDPKINSTFVVIGGGAAGNNCAETLRAEGFQGRLIMISSEKYLPYDRIKVSKVLNMEPENVAFRTEHFYKEADIEVRLDTKVDKIKTNNREIILNDGIVLEYNKVFIATGARGRKIKYPGSDLKNIFTLRNIEDGKALHAQLNPDTNLVIVGSSFIGMEVASYAVDKVNSVTVIGRSKIPFEQQLGELVGTRIRDLFVSKGVKFEMNNTVQQYLGKDGVVTGVTLKNGVVLDAQAVLVAMGSDNNTEFLAGGEIRMNMDGSIPVDRFLETNVKGVYAGGDIAFAPVFVCNDASMTIGHWGLAHYHGHIAALNMVGKAKPLASVPYFWTALFGLSFRFAGVTGKYDSVIINGSLEDLKFAAYYCEGVKVNSIVTVGKDPLASKFAEVLANNRTINKAEVTKQNVNWFEKPAYS